MSVETIEDVIAAIYEVNKVVIPSEGPGVSSAIRAVRSAANTAVQAMNTQTAVIDITLSQFMDADTKNRIETASIQAERDARFTTGDNT